MIWPKPLRNGNFRNNIWNNALPRLLAKVWQRIWNDIIWNYFTIPVKYFIRVSKSTSITFTCRCSRVFPQRRRAIILSVLIGCDVRVLQAVRLCVVCFQCVVCCQLKADDLSADLYTARSLADNRCRCYIELPYHSTALIAPVALRRQVDLRRVSRRHIIEK